MEPSLEPTNEPSAEPTLEPTLLIESTALPTRRPIDDSDLTANLDSTTPTMATKAGNIAQSSEDSSDGDSELTKNASEGMNAFVIAFAVFGMLFLCALFGVFLCVWRRRRQRRKLKFLSESAKINLTETAPGTRTATEAKEKGMTTPKENVQCVVAVMSEDEDEDAEDIEGGESESNENMYVGDVNSLRTTSVSPRQRETLGGDDSSSDDNAMFYAQSAQTTAKG